MRPRHIAVNAARKYSAQLPLSSLHSQRVFQAGALGLNPANLYVEALGSVLRLQGLGVSD